MEVKTYWNANDNSDYIIDIINKINKKISNNYWCISDLDLIPKVITDYSGIGKNEVKNVAYDFLQRIEREKTIILNSEELIKVLENTRTVYQAVLVCFSNDTLIDVKKFKPRVEETTSKKHEQSLYEIRILDGDLFYFL